MHVEPLAVAGAAKAHHHAIGSLQQNGLKRPVELERDFIHHPMARLPHLPDDRRTRLDAVRRLTDAELFESTMLKRPPADGLPKHHQSPPPPSPPPPSPPPSPWESEPSSPSCRLSGWTP